MATLRTFFNHVKKFPSEKLMTTNSSQNMNDEKKYTVILQQGDNCDIDPFMLTEEIEMLQLTSRKCPRYPL